MVLISPEIHQYFDGRFSGAEDEKEQVEVEKARALVTAYCLHYADDGLITRGIEEGFTLPILDPNTGEDTGRTYSGIVDTILSTDTGLLYFSDHKTAKTVDHSYWTELGTNAQLTQYFLAARQMGLEIEGFLWDVIVKPSISPKRLTKAAIKDLEDGIYCGLPYEHEYQGESQETPKMFGRRVLVEYTDNPDRYFQRRVLHRSDTEILEFMEELCAITSDLDEVKRNKSLQYRNLSACKRYGSMCEYHKICSGADPSASNYREREKFPEDQRTTGSGSYSPSRVACGLRCRREFAYRYVEKIERAKQEWNEHLALGTLVHEALEIWLKGRMSDPITLGEKCA